MNKHFYNTHQHNQHSPNQTTKHLGTIVLLLAIYMFQTSVVVAQTKDVGTGCASPVGPIGTGTSTSREYSPLNNYYKYGYTQIIYDASELGCTGTVNAIAFQYAQTTAINRTVDIYMGERTTATFGSTYDWTPVGSMQPVYSGTMSFSSNDWHWITLTSPYSYSGSGSLVVAILDMTGSYTNTNNTFRYSSSTGYKILYSRRDSPGAYDLATSFTGTRQTYRPNTKFCIDCCTTPRTLSFAGTPSTAMTYGGTQQITVAPYTGGGELTWHSSNEDILTVGNDGLVTAVGPGTATVTVVLGRDGDMCGASASVDITVSLACGVTITLNGNKEEEISCGTTYCFYDSGGPDGDYSKNESYTATFTSSGEITIRFYDFSSESASYDYMYIYDGDESGDVLLNKHGGASLPSPATMTATSGTMTVVWKSDGGVQKAGWTALITADGCCATPRTLTMDGCPASNQSIGASFDITATPSISGGDITWSSSKTDVATVEDGHVSTVGAGTTVITARIEEVGDLCSARDRCELTVSCGANDMTVGSGTSTNHYYGPVNVAYGYSYRQIIYPKEQLCKGVINGMAFNYALSTPMTIKNDVDIYVGERETAVFANSTDWSLPYDMELVYSGPINCTSLGWNWILFNSPYVYSGTKNLVVAIHDKSGTTSSSLYSNFYCTEEATNIQLHVEGDSPYTLDNVSSFTSEYRMAYRPNTKFCIDCCSNERTGMGNFKFCKGVVGLTVGGTLTIEVEGADEVMPGGTVVYSSSNTAVATVTADGTVTAEGNGTAIIKATIPAGDPAGYCPVSAKYIVNVGGGLPVYETIGDMNSTTTTLNTPIEGSFLHSWGQMIYYKELFENCGCLIRGITFFSNKANDYRRTTSIYVSSTDKTQFENKFDFVPETGTPAWSGYWDIVKGENTFTFATPIPYDCTKNLLIGVDCDVTSGNVLDYGYTDFFVTETVEPRSISAHHDGSGVYDPNISDMSSYPGHVGRGWEYPNIRIHFIDCPPTVVPTVSIDPANQQICAGGYISPITVTATGGVVSFSPSLPDGLNYDDETGQITGAVDAGAGTYNFNVVVTAPGGCFTAQSPAEVKSASLQATITISDPN